MKVLGSIVLFQIVSLTTAGILIPTAQIIEGPSSKTTLVGPDGSVIDSIAQGAKIVADHNTAFVAGPNTAASLKSADANAVVTQPIAAAPSTIVESHVLTPVVAAKTIVSEHKEIKPDDTISIARRHVHPIFVPVVAEPLVKTHIVPVVSHETVALAAGAKTSVSEQSQTIVHPHSANAVFFQNEPIVTAKVLPATIPIASEKITHEVVGTKTTVSEHSEKIYHPGHSVESSQAFVAHPVQVIAKTSLPLATVVGAKTAIIEHAQSNVHPGVLVSTQPITAFKTVDVVNQVPVGAKQIHSEHLQTVLTH